MIVEAAVRGLSAHLSIERERCLRDLASLLPGITTSIISIFVSAIFKTCIVSGFYTNITDKYSHKSHDRNDTDATHIALMK